MPKSDVVINGHLYDFACVELVVGAVSYPGVLAINFDRELIPGKIRGSDPSWAGRTPGQANYACDFEMLLSDWSAFRDVLGATSASYGRVPFNIAVTYEGAKQKLADGNEYALPVSSYAIRNCRVTKVEERHQAGPDALVVRVTVDPTEIAEGDSGYAIEKDADLTTAAAELRGTA